MSRLLLLQLDGLSRLQLERNLGQMPCVKRLLVRSHRLHTMYSGLPSTTPAFQGEFFYGVRQCVPAWYFRERASGQLGQLIYPAVSRRKESELKARGAGLLAGGSAYTCLVSGDAQKVFFGAGQSHLEHLRQVIELWPRFPAILGRAWREGLRACADAWSHPRGRRQFRDELRFLPKRTLLHSLFHESYRSFIPGDMADGQPVIYANFLSYDCLAHLRGPESDYACRSLSEIDRVIADLAAAAEEHNYQLWIFSDHGQETTTPFDLGGSGVLAERLGRECLGADHGPVAHLYFQGGDRRRLAERLVESEAVPQVMFLDQHGVQVLNRHGLFRLPRDWAAVLGPEHPFGPEAGLDLARMAHHPEAGRLVALGYLEKQRVTFLREYGSHGGAAPLETQAFALLPDAVRLPASARGLNGPIPRPLDLRRAALRAMGEGARGQAASSAGKTVDAGRRAGRIGYLR